jgi:hypothetical protein
MKKHNSHDERIVAQRRKINSEAFGILMIALLVSILVQQLLLDAPFGQYAVEFICFFGLSFFIIIRYVTLGLNIYGEGKRANCIPFITSIVTGVVVTTVNGTLNYIRYAEHYKTDGIGYFIAVLAITFISASISSFIFLSLVGYFNKKKQTKIQEQLDKDEQDK